VTREPNSESIFLTGNLLLNELSDKHFPEVASYQNVKQIDLQQLKNIDSAGLAYLAQIKTHYPDICFTGISDKILVLAKLYGLSFLFKS
jgi:phospholipid transport system transporter-binding protein